MEFRKQKYHNVKVTGTTLEIDDRLLPEIYYVYRYELLKQDAEELLANKFQEHIKHADDHILLEKLQTLQGLNGETLVIDESIVHELVSEFLEFEEPSVSEDDTWDNVFNRFWKVVENLDYISVVQ